MNCSTCGYFCSNEHLHCGECNAFVKGYCSVCKATTTFVQMDLSLPKSTMRPSPSILQSKEFCIEQLDQKSQRVLPKQIFEGIETQSRLSKEQLSMKDSEEYIENIRATEFEAHENLGIEKNCSKDEICMKTLFMGIKPAENSISLSDFSDHQNNSKSLNAEEFLKVQNNKSFNHSSTNYKDVKKENIFLFKEDPNDYNIFKTSDIRFMDSIDSLQNVFTESRPIEMATASSVNCDQTKSLSTKVLRDFDSQNSFNSREAVNNYLQTYSPTAFYQAPAYNCQQSFCNFSDQPEKQQIKMTMRTVSVSTESDPSLKSSCIDGAGEKLKSHDCLVMQAVGVAPPAQDFDMVLDNSKNSNKHSIDMRMQKILETFKEDAKVTKFTDKSQLINISPEVSAKEEEKELIEKTNLKEENKNSDLVAQLLNTHRCFYNPPNPLIVPVNNLHQLPRPKPVQQEPPLPQYQNVSCSSASAQELLLSQRKFLSIKLVPASQLNIPRSPIQCPESTCQRMIFVSDFNKHLVVDHNHLPMERITPFQCKNFFLDVRLSHFGTNKCHLLYLMRDKIIDLGSSEYKDFLPIMVMSTRISLNQMCDLKNQTPTLEYFLIWVTSIVPEEFPVSVLLTVWSRSGRVPACHVLYSGQMYSVRNSQNALDVWQSGRMILLSSQEIDALTGNGKQMLNLQLSVH